MINAAFFEAGVAVAIMRGTIRQLNANTSPTRVWRQIDDSITELGGVPPFETLSVHDGHVQRA